MRAGRLRHTVTIREATETENDDGTVDVSYTDVIDRKAGIRSLEGRELFEAQQVVAEASHAITLRYYAGLNPKTNDLVFGERVFEIGQVRNVDERNKQTVCVCVERV